MPRRLFWLFLKLQVDLCEGSPPLAQGGCPAGCISALPPTPSRQRSGRQGLRTDPGLSLPANRHKKWPRAQKEMPEEVAPGACLQPTHRACITPSSTQPCCVNFSRYFRIDAARVRKQPRTHSFWGLGFF